MEFKFKVGDEVLVVDQKPAVIGVVKQCSTWRKVNNTPNDGVCYFIKSESWQAAGSWIAESHLIENPLAANIFQCSICHGIVDRYEHLFRCRNCGAVGDLMTGIMSDRTEVKK